MKPNAEEQPIWTMTERQTVSKGWRMNRMPPTMLMIRWRRVARRKL